MEDDQLLAVTDRSEAQDADLREVPQHVVAALPYRDQPPSFHAASRSSRRRRRPPARRQPNGQNDDASLSGSGGGSG